MSELTYDGIVNAVLEYYDTDSSIFNRIVTGQASQAEVYNAFSYIPQAQYVRTISGATMGIDFKQGFANQYPTTVSDIAGGVDSNLGFGSYSGGSFYGNIPGDFSTSSGGALVSAAGARVPTATPGVYSTLATVADKLSLGVTGISIGAKLGKAIDQALYDIAPAWWDEHLPAINPATWVTIAGGNPGGEAFIRGLFGIKNDGSAATAYIDERVLAYYYMMMRDMGMWATGGESATIEDTTGLPQNVINGMPYVCGDNVTFTGTYNSGIRDGNPNYYVPSTSNSDFKCFVYFSNDGSNYVICCCSKTPIQGKFYTWNQYGQWNNDFSSYSRTINGNPIYYYSRNFPTSDYAITSPAVNNVLSDATSYISYIIQYGTITTEPTLPGTSNLPDSTQYPPTGITGTTPDHVLTQLKTQYPSLFNDGITQGVLQEDGSIKDYNYIPIPYPTGVDPRTISPTTPADTEQDNTDVNPETLPRIVTEGGTQQPPTDPPDTGTGTAAPPALPTGSASSLWAVYNPTQAELNSFGSWLWSSDFVEQLKKLFNDPMQAIIGVHKVFATPPTGGSQSIKCGYLDSGVSAAVVTGQYVTVDCGTVKLSEQFGNVFDYSPHTRVSAYLPFIGVVALDIDDVMRASINIKYGVDVITGACLAMVNVTRDGGGGILYSYGGSCAVHYPISSGSYTGIISAALTAATGIIGTAVSGNPMSAVGGIASGIKQAHTNVQKSGGFTGSSGACGPKKPYLIISRPQTRLENNYEHFDGIPANFTTTLAQCSGMVKCKVTHLEIGGAYSEEKAEIESILSNGILI